MASGGSTAAAVPEVALRFGNARPMPAVGIGTAASTPVTHDATKNAVLAAIEVGFRNLDTASMYGSARPWPRR
jgi:diketogulonate reductase-like aldo/keto reductase